MESVIITEGCRRFTCLSPTLVRMEFAPDGRFEERRSVVAFEKQTPVRFKSIKRTQDECVLDTGVLTIISSQNDRAFFKHNLEVRWPGNGLLQYWKPGDRDYRNLGGALRSLDRYGTALSIDGVHVADGQPPDAGTEWISWFQDEDDAWYYTQTKRPDRDALNKDLHGATRHNLDTILERARNRVLEGLKYGVGVLSRSGYFLLNDSVSPLLDDDGFPVERNRPGYQDWYFFGYARDYRAALSDFIRLCGRAALPSKNVLGLIFCRWPAPDAIEARTIVEEFRTHAVPLSALVLDMEWHKEGWGHWEWNPLMYPDPEGFFRWCHDNGLHVGLNDHPNDIRDDDAHFQPYLRKAGSGARVRTTQYGDKTLKMVDIDWCNKQEARAFSDLCHAPIVKQGLDFWWNDGCRGKINGGINMLVCNKQSFEVVETTQKRGMLLSRSAGVGSHRYGVFFTGDTSSCWNVLRTQVEFNIRAGHLGFAYVSHDLGGFVTPGPQPLIDPQLYIRWVQFGALNPVFRFHSAPEAGSRKPWDYGPGIEKIARVWMGLRNSLLPYIYTAARYHYDTGVPLVRGMFLEEPDDERAYRFDQYYFGPDLLVAPIAGADSARDVYLPEGDWYSLETNIHHDGDREMLCRPGLETIPVFVKAGTILVRQPPTDRPATPHVGALLLDVYPGAAGEAWLYEDDGHSPAYQRGICCRTHFQMDEAKGVIHLRGAVVEGKPLGDRRELSIEISLDNPPRTVGLKGGKRAFRPEVEKLFVSGRYRIHCGSIRAARPFEVRIEKSSLPLIPRHVRPVPS